MARSHPASATGLVLTTCLLIVLAGLGVDAQAQRPTLSGRVTDGHGHGVANASVTLHYYGSPQWGGHQSGRPRVDARTDASGYYSMRTAGPVDWPLHGLGPTVTVTLAGPVSNIPGGRIANMAMRSQRAYSYLYASATTPVLASTSGTLSIDLSNNSGINWTTLLSINDLDRFASMYVHFHQGTQFAINTLGLSLDHALPIDCYGDSPTGTGTWYTDTPFTTPAGSAFPASSVSVDAGDNGYFSGNRPDNREWHEVGHHIMADSLIGGDNALPALSSLFDVYHAGYLANSDTVAGWTEGFAEFMSCQIATLYPAFPVPVFTPTPGPLPPNPPQWYGGWGNPRWWDLEWQTDLRGPTRLDEEFAIAGILWDLEDPVSAADSDAVDLTLAQIWGVLDQNTAPGTGGRRETLRDVYDAFVVFAAGNPALRAGIDQIFVAHGAFDDVNGNRVRDPGEQIGSSGDPARPGRRNTPYLENSFIRVTTLDAETLEPVVVDGFLVSESFAPPHAELDAEFVVAYFDDSQSAIHFSMAPSPQYSTTASVTPVAAGYCNVVPLVLDNHYYWHQIETADLVAEHTFLLPRCRAEDGMTIERNTMLWPDDYAIHDFGGDGVIVLGAPGVTLDCNGARLIGGGTGIGIHNPGLDDVTIRNCDVAGYRHGILLDGAQRNTLVLNRVEANWGGISAYAGGAHWIARNTVVANDYGLDIASQGNSLSENQVSGNLHGIWLESASGNRIYHNNLLGNAVSGSDTDPPANDWAHPALLEGNHWSDYPGEDDGSGSGIHAIAGDGIGDSFVPHPGPDYDLYPFVEPSGWQRSLTEARADCTPRRLNLDSEGRWVSCRVALPVYLSVADIDVRSVALGGVPADWGQVTGDRLLVKFDREAVAALGTLELELTGLLQDGSFFQAAVEIRSH